MLKYYCGIVFMLFNFLNINTISAKVKLPAVFSSNMVLQQQSDVPFWGEAAPNKKVKITTSWNNKVYEIVSNANGKWKTNVSTPVYGGPYNIEITDGSKLKLENVLIGEVWVCSGQSNMEMPLAGWGKILNYEQEIATANYPNIRLLQVVKNTSTKPLDDMSVAMGGWVPCSSKTVAEFSSVAYFFGKNLFMSNNIPIGLINTSWGGTIAEAWTSANSLKTMPDFSTPVQEMEKNNASLEEAKLTYEKELAEWEHKIQVVDRGFANGKPAWADKNLNEADWKTISNPTNWKGLDIATIDGVVWMRKTIDIPLGWQNKQLMLNLYTIDDNDITYFNGVEVGRTDGFGKLRKYQVPASLVKHGKAVITVRVNDTGGDGGIWGSAEKLELVLSADQKIDLTGNWFYKTGFSLTEVSAAPKNWNDPNRPTVLFNAMIQPIIPFTIKGAIWYQGESNSDRAYQYKELFPLMIKDWREKWNINFPFYFVQLANFMGTHQEPSQSSWAELREAQFQTLHLENTGMAVAIDIGASDDIHPKNKQEVGHRLALLAQANTYGQKIVSAGPIYDSYKVEQNSIRIKFRNGNLKIKDASVLKGFTIAGLDHKFVWADARIEGNEVVVSNKDITHPIAVRYAWDDNPICNLYNEANLPASPFRTDDWSGLTYMVK